MGTKNRLYEMITIDELSIPLGLVCDLCEFAKVRKTEIEHEIDILTEASESEYLASRLDVRKGLKDAIDDAESEKYHWYALSVRFSNIMNDNSNKTVK